MATPASLPGRLKIRADGRISGPQTSPSTIPSPCVNGKLWPNGSAGDRMAQIILTTRPMAPFHPQT